MIRGEFQYFSFNEVNIIFLQRIPEVGGAKDSISTEN